MEKAWVIGNVQSRHVVSFSNKMTPYMSISYITGLSSTCVVTLLRLIRIKSINLADTDPTISGAIVAQWSILEPTLGIVNSCFPTIRPVLHKYGPSFAWTKRTTNKDSPGIHKTQSTPSPLSSKVSPSSTISGKKQFQRLEDDIYPLQEIYVSGNKASPSILKYSALGVDGIVVPPQPNESMSGITYTREWKVQSSVEESWV